MATRTWNSSGSTDMNLSTNYSGSGALLTTDDLIFNSTSVINAIATANLDVGSVTITSAFTGQWSISGFSLIVENNTGFSDSGITGAHHYGNAITLNGASAVFSCSPTGTLTGTSCALTFNGTTGCTLTSTLTFTFKTLTLGANAVLTYNSSAAAWPSFQSSTTPLIFTNGGTLTSNGSYLSFMMTSGGAFVSILAGTPTINGTGQIRFALWASNQTFSLPALTYSGTGLFYIQGIAGIINSIMNLAGDLNLGLNGTLYCQVVNDSTNFTFNTNNYAITCKNFYWGALVSTTSSYLNSNFGSSTITVNGVIIFYSFLNANLQTSTWSCKGSVTIGTRNTINPGTSSVTITDTATITSNGYSFYTFIINASGKTVTLADDLFVNTYTLTAGTLARANFYMYVLSAGTTNIWSAAADGNWNVAGNWSLGHSPTPAEDAVFTAVSVKNLTINVSPTVANIAFSGAYTGTVTWAGQTVTTNGAFSDYGSGAKNYGNGINLNGTNANMSVGAGAGTITGTSCNLISNGAGNAFWDTKSVTFKTLTISANSGLSLLGASLTIFSNSTTLLTMGDNSFLTAAKTIRYVLTGSSAFYSLGTGYTISCVGGIPFQFVIGANNVAAQLPAVTATGTTFNLLDINNYSNWSYQWTGAMLLTNGGLGVQQSNSNGSTSLYDFNNQNVLCTTFTVGRSGGTSAMTVNFGSGIFNIQAFSGNSLATGCTLNLQSCTINSSGVTFTNAAANTVNVGTSQVNLIGNTTVTSNGQPFYNLTINPAVVVTVVDSITIANGGTFTNNSNSVSLNPTTSTTLLNFLGAHTFNGTGTVSIGGATASLTITLSAFTYTGSGAWTINPAATSTTVFSGATSLSSNLTLTGGAVTFSSSLTFTGSNTFTIGAGIGTFLGTSCDLIFNGTGASLADNKSVTLKTLTMGAGSSLTIAGPQNTVFSSSTTPLILGNNAALTLTAATTFLVISSSNPFMSLGSGYSVGGTGGLYFYASANGITATIPAYTHSGSGGHRLGVAASYTGWTIRLTGPINVNTGYLDAMISANSASGTFDFNDQNVTCGIFRPGCSSSISSITIYYGSGTYNVSTYAGTSYAQGSGNIYFETSQWFCSGNWAQQTAFTVDAGTSTVTILAAATNFYNSGQPFYNLILNAGAALVTCTDQIKIANGGSLTVNSPLTMNPTTSIQVLNFLGTYTFNGTSTIAIGGATASLTITFPAFTYTGSGSWTIAPASTSTTVFSGDVSHSGNIAITAGNLSCSGTWTLNGASGNLTFGAAIPAYNLTACNLIFNGTTGMTLTDNKSVLVRSLTLGPGAKVISNGGATTVVTCPNVPLTLGANAYLTLNAGVSLRVSDNDGTFTSLGSGYTLNGSGNITFSAQGSNQKYLPGLNYTGTGKFNFYEINSGCTINFSGPQNYGDRSCNISTLSGSSTFTLNFNGYDLTCGTFTVGATTGAGLLTLNYGSGGISVGTYNAFELNTSNTIENFQSSRWTCAKSWTQSSVHQITPGTSTVTFTGDSTITSYGKPFYDTTFFGPNKTFNLWGSMFTHNYTKLAGTINYSGFNIYQSVGSNAWVALTDSSWSGDLNWSLGHAPTGSENILFSNAYSGKDCTVDIPLSVRDWGVSGDYTGDITLSGQTLTLNGKFSDYGSGTRHYGSSINVADDTGSLVLGASLGTITSNTADLTFSGTVSTYLSDWKSVSFKTLTIQPNAVVYHTNPSSVSTNFALSSGTWLTMGSNSKLYLGAALPPAGNGGFINVGVNGTATAWSIAPDATIFAGPSIIYLNNNSVGGTLTVPGITYTNSTTTSYLVLRSQTNYNTVNLAGDINLGVGSFQTYGQGCTDSTFNSNGYKLTCGAINSGNSVADKTYTLNWGSSDISCTSFSSSMAFARTNYNFESSRWYVTTTWTESSNWTVNPGTSTISFLGTGAINFNNQPAYNVVWNTVSNHYLLDTLIIADGGSITAHTAIPIQPITDMSVFNFLGSYTFGGNGGLTVMLGNTLTYTFPALTYTGSGPFTFNPRSDCTILFTGNLVLGGNLLFNSGGIYDCAARRALTLTGASAQFLKNAAVTVLFDNIDTTMSGTVGMQYTNNTGGYLRSLNLTPGARVTANGSGSPSMFGNPPLRLEAGSFFNQNAPLALRPITPDSSHFYKAPDATWQGTGSVQFYPGNQPLITYIPAYDRTAPISFGIPAGANFAVLALAGNMDISSNTFSWRGSGIGRHGTFDFNGYNLRCGVLQMGADVSGTDTTVKFGDGTFTITKFDPYKSQYTDAYFGDAKFICSGDWTDSTSWIMDHPPTSLTFVGNTASSFITNARPYGDVTCNKITAGVVNFVGGDTTLNSLVIADTNTQPVSWAGLKMTVFKDMTFGGTGTLNIGTEVISFGSGTMWFKSTLGTVTSSTARIRFKDTTGVNLRDDKGLTLNNIVLENNAKVTTTGSATCLVASTGIPLTTYSNATLTVNSPIDFFRSTTGDIHNILSGSVINGTGRVGFSVNSNSVTITVPATNYTGTGAVELRPQGAQTGLIFNLGGDFSSTGDFTVACHNAAAQITFNTNNYNMVSRTFTAGTGVAFTTGYLTINNGSSRMICDNYIPLNIYGFTHNFQSSRWIDNTNWFFYNNQIIDTTLSDFTFSDANQHLIITNGKSFPKCYVEANTSIAWH